MEKHIRDFLSHEDKNNNGNIIYKYVPLETSLINSNNGEIKNDSLDPKRIKDLLESKLWFSKYDYLNDPFEGTPIAFMKHKYKGAGACQDLNNRLVKMCVAIASFSSEYNNILLWAHYANNHRGFCLEYTVNNPKLVFEVSYRSEREKDYLFSPYTANTPQELEYFGNQLSTKSVDWKYENESRIIVIDKNGISGTGMEVKLTDMDLTLNRIIGGVNCLPENRYVLKECAKHLNVDYAQAILSNKKYSIYIRRM